MYDSSSLEYTTATDESKHHVTICPFLRFIDSIPCIFYA